MAAALEDSCSLKRDKARAIVGETQVSHKRYFPILTPGGSHISKGHLVLSVPRLMSSS